MIWEVTIRTHCTPDADFKDMLREITNCVDIFGPLPSVVVPAYVPI